MPKTTIFREGDTVQLTAYRPIERVGYALSLRKQREVIEDSPELRELLLKILPDIESFLRTVGSTKSEASPTVEAIRSGALQRFKLYPSHPAENVLRALGLRGFLADLAFASIRAQGFGGRTRSIHYEKHGFSEEQLQRAMSLKYTVIGKRCVKTGEYYPPSGDDEYYEAGGLENEKTHILLTLQSPVWWPGNIEVEACDVQRVA